MYVKVRDVENGKWWSVYNVGRLVENDPISLTGSNDQKMAKLKSLQDELNPNLSVLPEKNAENIDTVILVNTISDGEPDEGQKEYSILLTTYAYVCNESGHTVDRIVADKGAYRNRL